MDVQRDKQRGAADAGGPPPRLHPVPLHGLYQLQAGRRHGVRSTAQPQLAGKAVDVQRRVHWPARKNMPGLSPDVSAAGSL